MKKRNLSEIQNILFVIIVALCLILLNVKSISMDMRIVLIIIAVISYIAFLIIEIIKLKNQYRKLSVRQRISYILKIFLLTLILIGFLITLYSIYVK